MHRLGNTRGRGVAVSRCFPVSLDGAGCDVEDPSDLGGGEAGFGEAADGFAAFCSGEFDSVTGDGQVDGEWVWRFRLVLSGFGWGRWP
jgi:hypothetical protein